MYCSPLLHWNVIIYYLSYLSLPSVCQNVKWLLMWNIISVAVHDCSRSLWLLLWVTVYFGKKNIAKHNNLLIIIIRRQSVSIENVYLLCGIQTKYSSWSWSKTHLHIVICQTSMIIFRIFLIILIIFPSSESPRTLYSIVISYNIY